MTTGKTIALTRQTFVGKVILVHGMKLKLVLKHISALPTQLLRLPSPPRQCVLGMAQLSQSKERKAMLAESAGSA